MKDLSKIARWKHSVEKMEPHEVGVEWVSHILRRKLQRLGLSDESVAQFAKGCLKTARMAMHVPRSLNPAFDGQQRLDFMASRLNPEFARLMSDPQLIIETRCTNLHKASATKLESF